MKASPTIRRFAVTLALAIVIACVVTPFSEGAAAILFLLVFVPSWIALFFAWPFFSRKATFECPRPAGPSPAHWFSFSRLIITGLLATLFAAMLATTINSDSPAIWILPFWLALYFGWYYLIRRFPGLNPEKAPVGPAASPGHVQLRPRYARRKSIQLALVLLFLFLIFLPGMLSFQKARTLHNSIHVGMTVPEVLPTVKDCDLFSASSDFSDKNGDGGNLPEMRLSWNKDGTYRTYDFATGKDISMTEAETVERLHATLHDGSTWTFHYLYTNITPQHVAFRVVFGIDGRVSEVQPIFSFD